MPAPVTPSDFQEVIPGSTLSNLCEKIKLAWLRLPDILYQLVNYMFDANGRPSTDFVNEIASTTSPPGTIAMFGGTNAPSGWLECNGGAVSRTTYANLFAAIGTTYGAPSASTFSLPNLTNRFPFGRGGSYPIGGTGGALSAEVPGYDTHRHVFGRFKMNDDVALQVTPQPGTPDGTATGREVGGGGAGITTNALSSYTDSWCVTSVPVDLATDTMDITPPYIAVMFIIKT